MNNSEFYSNTDDVPSTTWADPLWPMGDYPYPNLSVPQGTLTNQNFFDPWSTPGPFSDFNAADDAAFSFVPTTEMGLFANLPTQADYTSQNFPDTWSMQDPYHFYENSAVSQPQLAGDPHWTGIAPLATYPVAATQDSGMSPTSTTPTSQDEWAWLDQYLQTPHSITASSPGPGGEGGWIAPEHGTDVSEVRTSPAGWTSGFSWPIPVAPGDVTSNVTETSAPATALGKRRHKAEQPLDDGGPAGTHTYEMPPPKRARGGGTPKGIRKAARSAARTRHKPVARIPKQVLISKPKEAGRGAERLATPSSQGIYHQSLPGPSVQQGWAVDAADGKLTGVEGSVDEEAVRHTDSAVPQRHEEATEYIRIPRIFKPEYRSLLQASEADFARGAVQAIKCRLCPDTKLKNFEEFKRHCKTTETHPLDIHFCGHCGDFFARLDSLKRHRNLPPGECLKVTPVMAAEKHRVTKEEHNGFKRRLAHCLVTGEDIGRPFSQIIKERYPESSKKRTGGSK